MRPGYGGESGYYANNWPDWRHTNLERARAMVAGKEALPLSRSHEYAADVVEAVSLDRPATIHANVRNIGLIDNLPDGCVEIACCVDANGITPLHFGVLPEQLAALNRSHMAVHTLMVNAILGHDRQAARYALLLDPLTAAVCSPAEISAMFDELWAAQEPCLERYL